MRAIKILLAASVECLNEGARVVNEGSNRSERAAVSQGGGMKIYAVRRLIRGRAILIWALGLQPLGRMMASMATKAVQSVKMRQGHLLVVL